MQSILILIHLFIAVALIFVVLLQRSEGGALGIGGSGGAGGLGGLFSPRGAASTLTRATAILGFLFLLTSMSLTWISLGARQATSILDAGPAAPGAPPALPSGAPPTLPSGAPPAAPPTFPAAPAGN